MRQSENLFEKAREVMSAHWRSGSKPTWGYTAPNPERYEWQWLWDSCFHAIIWAELGEADRGLLELATLLETMEPSGFLPHMNYVADPAAAKEFWGREGTSSITQPPMFGHAIAELVRKGVDVPEELVEKAALGLRFFLQFRIHKPSGLIVLCHPWESGADDSLRWDSFYAVPYGHPRWQDEKIKLMETIARDSNGTPLSNPRFPVASAWFTAVVAFNIAELANATGAIDKSEATGLVEAVESSWDDVLHTWVDTATTEIQQTSSPPIRKSDSGDSKQTPVLEALLGVLADRNEERLAIVCEDLFNPSKYGAPYGPAGVSQSHKSYEGHSYWRGATWPQLTYLLCHALQARANSSADRASANSSAARLRIGADSLATQLRSGAITSNFAEHWHPQTAHPGGATPQSWTALAIVS